MREVDCVYERERGGDRESKKATQNDGERERDTDAVSENHKRERDGETSDAERHVEKEREVNRQTFFCPPSFLVSGFTFLLSYKNNCSSYLCFT